MKLIDHFLNSITMYRLVLYVLIFLLCVATVLSAFKILPYNPLDILFSTIFLVTISWLTNIVFAKVWQVPTNVESVYITALILALIISPQVNIDNFFLMFWAGVLSQASKYILAINKKHLFNPAAIAVVITAIFANQSANWWVGSSSMFWFVLLSGLLVVRKIQRTDLVFSFLLSSLVIIATGSIFKGIAPNVILQKTLFDTPILFFAFIMLTEPLTTPPTNFTQSIYGLFTGILFYPQIHLGSFYTTPELALCIANIYAYLASPKSKLLLKFKQKIRLTADTYNFVFTGNTNFHYKPGQYMEFTLPHDQPDNRGNRRYFTLASSPTEPDIQLGIKFYENSSSFKKSLLNLKPDQNVLAAQLSGDFVLPKDKNKKYIFVAGGIGITPFRSMLKYLSDHHEHRDIILIYTNKNTDDIAYKDELDRAAADTGIKIIYVLTDTKNIPNTWNGLRGRVDPETIKSIIPDYLDRTFYISGPHSMVTSFETILVKMKLRKNQIKTDFFPGFV